MSAGSRPCCVGSLTRWVTLLVVIQCCLVLLYITFIQTSSSGSLRLSSTSPVHVSRDKAAPREFLRPAGEPPGELLHYHLSPEVGVAAAKKLRDIDRGASRKDPSDGNSSRGLGNGSNQLREKRPIFLQRSLIAARKHPPGDSDSISDANAKLRARERGPGIMSQDKNIRVPDVTTGDNRVPEARDGFRNVEKTGGQAGYPVQFIARKERVRLAADEADSDEEALKLTAKKMDRGQDELDVGSSSWPNLFARCHDIVNRTTFPEVVWVPDDETQRFVRQREASCLEEGTIQLFNSSRRNTTKCICRRNWHGQRCTIPDSVLFSEAGQYVNSMKIRGSPRRIVNAIAFNVEFELLEARLHELGDSVDLYILHESNYTNYGTAKPLRLLQRLRQGYLRQYQHKILYLYRGDFPSQGRVNGWVVDQSQRTFISEHSLKHLRNLRPDDLFIYNDADEIPSRDALLFLKLHDGYPEPIGFSLRWSVFGFYWREPEPTRVMAACSLQLLKNVFQGDIFKVRSHSFEMEETNVTLIDAFVRSGGVFHDWFMAEEGGFAGWHCSWCLSPEGVRIKLKSAINADFPRWGDFPEKLDTAYIRKLISTGTWFDDQTTFSMVTPRNDPHFAPRYAFQRYSRFRHLLDRDFYQT